MWKSLAAKTMVPVVGSVAGFVIVCCLLLYSNLERDRVDERILHANDVASVVEKSTRYAMLKEDRETLRRIVSNVGEELLVEHVRIFNKRGVIVFSGREKEVGGEVDKSEEGCLVCHSAGEPIETLGPMEQARRYVSEDGVHVMAVTEPIYNQPECSSAPCHYHHPGQVVLGTLDIGLSEEPLQRALRLLRRQLALFCVMVVALSAGGVAALLQRNLLAPIRTLSLRVVRVFPRPELRAAGELGDDLAVLEEAVGILEQAGEPGGRHQGDG